MFVPGWKGKEKYLLVLEKLVRHQSLFILRLKKIEIEEEEEIHLILNLKIGL